ncbi:MAG: hypothetical protein KF893_09290 [Caldilineaceae bacterium]|nr:hypothetical protein [Caldilineaceae bacterium]
MPPFIEEMAASLAQRQMLRPALLFLIGHRPFGFVVGQCLLLALPLGLLFPAWQLRPWADLLSHPQGVDRLESYLRAHIDPSNPSMRTAPRPSSPQQ